MRRVKCGVLGAGWWATYAHIPALLEDPRAELVAVQTRTAEEAEKIARHFGVPVACTTADELLSIPDIEAVVVSSSPHLHFEQAKSALEYGKHVLIEKPMTLTAAQAAELVEIASSNHLRFLISCPWHYTRHAVESQALIRRGTLGEIRMISVLMTNPVSHLIRGFSNQPTHGTPFLEPNVATYADPAVAGGGQIYTQVCHVAAYLTFLTGATANSVFARFHNDGAALDIYDTLNIRLNNEALVSVASTGATGMTQRTYEVRVFGTQGILYLELWRGTMRYVDFSGNEFAFTDLTEEEIYPHRAPAHNLLDSIDDPENNQSPATLGAAAMALIEAACLSSASGQPVDVALAVRLQA